jgi:hypothetical protein
MQVRHLMAAATTALQVVADGTAINTKAAQLAQRADCGGNPGAQAPGALDPDVARLLANCRKRLLSHASRPGLLERQ